MDQLPRSTPEFAPDGGPSMLGGNVTPPTNDEIYQQKISILEGVIREQTDDKITEFSTALVDSYGGPREAQRFNIWEEERNYQAPQLRRAVVTLLNNESSSMHKPEEDKDVFDRVITRISHDIEGVGVGGSRLRGRDAVDLNIGGELQDLLDTDKLQDRVILAKATRTIRLLTAVGHYKLHQWPGATKQLQTALDLTEAYAKQVPDFDPYLADLGETEDRLIAAQAALRADQITKPNYAHAYPERKYLFSQIKEALGKVHRVHAHDFLRSNDFGLPQ